MAEASLGHQRAQVGIRGTDEAHVYVGILRAAQPAHFALLQCREQLTLHGGRQVAYFVQEERAARCCFHASGLRLLGIREGSLLVSEQFALEEILRHGPQVDAHVRAFGARREAAQFAGHQILAGAILAQDEHIGIRGCHLSQVLEEHLHRHAFPDDVDWLCCLRRASRRLSCSLCLPALLPQLYA